MKIVFDTNVIFEDWFLNKPEFEIFKVFLILSRSKLVVPKLVIEEAKNKYRETVKKTFDSASSKLRELSGLLPFNNLSMPNVDLERAFSNYEECLQERLTDLNAEMPCHSDVPHDDVIKRCFERRKPFRFQNSEKASERGGYRDTLIWEVILRKVADASYETIFITANVNDFGEKDSDQVNEHLRKDLQSKDLPDNCVKRCDSLATFNNKYAKPLLHKLMKEKIKEKPQLKELTTLWFKDNRNLVAKILQTKVDSLSWPSKLESYVQGPTIKYIEDPSVFEVEEVYELDADKVYIDIFMETGVNVDFFVYKYDYWEMSNDIPFEVWEEDWDESYIWASITLREPISLTMTFNTKEGKVDKFEADFLGKPFEQE